MLKLFTYPKSKPMRWLSIVLVSLSCFAFSLSPVPADAGQALPTQIEQVVSGKRDDNKSPVSIQKFVPEASSLYTANRSRDHEKYVLVAYQKEINVRFESFSKRFHSFFLPERFLPLRIIPDDSDKESTSLLVV